jgi:hypothetical protein
MGKRILALLFTWVVIATTIGASSFQFIPGKLEAHSEFADGAIPTFFTMGVEYTGLEFIPEQTTKIIFNGGGGYTLRRLWQDNAGNVMEPGVGTDDLDVLPYVYDQTHILWNLYLSQGFFHSDVSGTDLVSAYAGYEGRFESNMETLFSATRFATEQRDFVTFDILDGTTYPDLGGNQRFLSTVLAAGLRFNMMNDQVVSQLGVSTDLSVRYAPAILNNDQADYFAATLNIIGAFPLYSMKNDESLNVLSLTVVDRLRVDYLTGDTVPVFAQEAAALGGKVRGFSPLTYNTEFSVVNNLDLRFCGPEPFVAGVCPRFILFYDLGYHAGQYFNSNTSGSHVISSLGVQFTVTLFDMFDLGYYVSYLAQGKNFLEEAMQADTKVVAGVVLSLAF